MSNPKSFLFITLAIVVPTIAQTPSHIELATVESRNPSKTVALPAELAPFLQADIEARVPGYVERVLVDRGSNVRRGQVLVELSAPEMKAQTAAAESTLHQAEADQSQAEAQAAGLESTFARLQEASKTPGAVAGNELVQAEKERDAAQSLVSSRKAATRAADDRLVHPGMLVEGGRTPLLKLQQIGHLRLTVPVPETYVGHVTRGALMNFHVMSQPGKTFSAKIARISNALDSQTRTMMVELDVYNSDGKLAPGMYPTVDWPASSAQPLLLVPTTSVVSTTERTFVIAAVNGHAHWINVRKGASFGDQVAIGGDIREGQKVVKRATDELREGTPLL